MNSYQIENRVSGLILGVYEGATEADALRAIAEDSGDDDFATLADDVEAGRVSLRGHEIIVKQVAKPKVEIETEQMNSTGRWRARLSDEAGEASGGWNSAIYKTEDDAIAAAKDYAYRARGLKL